MKVELRKMDGIILDYYLLLSLGYINFPEDSLEGGEQFYVDKLLAPHCHSFSIFSFNSLSLPVAAKILKDKGYSVSKINHTKEWTVWDDAHPGMYYSSDNFEEAIIKYHIKRRYGAVIDVCETALLLDSVGERLKCY